MRFLLLIFYCYIFTRSISLKGKKKRNSSAKSCVFSPLFAPSHKMTLCKVVLEAKTQYHFLSGPLVTSQSADSQGGTLAEKTDVVLSDLLQKPNRGLGIETNYPIKRDPFKKKQKKARLNVQRGSHVWSAFHLPDGAPLSHLPLQQDQAYQDLY